MCGMTMRLCVEYCLSNQLSTQRRSLSETWINDLGEHFFFLYLILHTETQGISTIKLCVEFCILRQLSAHQGTLTPGVRAGGRTGRERSGEPRAVLSPLCVPLSARGVKELQTTLL